VHRPDGIMARVTADLLVRHLLAGGYVITKKGGAEAPTTPTCRPHTDRDYRQYLRPPGDGPVGRVKPVYRRAIRHPGLVREQVPWQGSSVVLVVGEI
jgi:hypothetical protein